MNTGAMKHLNQALIRQAEPCPKTESGAEPTKNASDWAKEKLNSHPEPKQAEVLNSNSKYLILCCNRQWGKTTTIAIKALHYALNTRLLQLITGGCLICPRHLPNLEVWVTEMLSLSGCGGPSSKAGDHDDLTMAAALAAWIAVRDAHELAPGDANSAPKTIGFVDKPRF